MTESFKRQQKWLYDNGFMEFTYGPHKNLNQYGQYEIEFVESVMTDEERARFEEQYQSDPYERRHPRANCIR